MHLRMSRIPVGRGVCSNISTQELETVNRLSRAKDLCRASSSHLGLLNIIDPTRVFTEDALGSVDIVLVSARLVVCHGFERYDCNGFISTAIQIMRKLLYGDSGEFCDTTVPEKKRPICPVLQFVDDSSDRFYSGLMSPGDRLSWITSRWDSSGSGRTDKRVVERAPGRGESTGGCNEL